ncbi:methyltransferase domain-containing protein [Comamonas sp.]|uniref:class I SAM-dependent methyltransferase n=1 Tax=Comamonas sp. TaxID=34028 RepID=UPI00289F79D0|nr:methyltransferase domain-containing protein [Comamonas sp.]
MTSFRKWLTGLRHTPLHPQWLLGSRSLPPNMSDLEGRVLDIGAADRWLEPHIPTAAEYWALDYPATGQDMYGAKPDVFADGAQLPFADQTFTTVFCLEVLEHVPYPMQVMQELSRVLKPGGHAYISMPFLYPLHDAPYDYQRYTAYGLRRDAEGAGLEVIQIQPTGHAMRTVGLLACLALAGGASGGPLWRQVVLLTLAAPMVLGINLTAWLLSWFWPNWSHIQHGHTLIGVKK